MDRTEEQLFDECVFQIGALKGLALSSAWPLRYLKPHGADDETIRKRMKYAGMPPVYIPMPPH